MDHRGTAALPPWLRALLQAMRRAHPEVDLLETHGAWVLLAGGHAYKFKKPVRLPFMDFGTLALRREACLAEVRLNRRFETEDPASHLYQGVLPLLGPATAPAWGRPGEDDGRAIEYAVHMRRFDQACRLDELCRRGALRPAHLTALAQRMARFQTHSAAMPAEGAHGHPEELRRLARDNLTALRGALGAPEDPAALQALEDWTETAFAGMAARLAQRRAEGRVREGHGDLHLANLVLIGEDVVPFDGIEFNDALRWIDVASEMAFPWMDLLDHGRPGLANGLLSDWLDASGDASAPFVWRFFAVYRALVRAKVAAIRGAQPGADGPAALAEARSYVALAGRIARPAAPRLVITHGLSGSGKTHASGRWLQQETSGQAIRLRSDVARKHLHGLDALQASASAPGGDLYSPQAHRDTYEHLRRHAGDLLRDGWSVLVDAAFLRRHEREAFAELARSLDCPFHILATEAPLAVLRERIRRRQAQGRDASEATVEVLERQLDWLEPLEEAERLRCLPVPN